MNIIKTAAAAGIATTALAFVEFLGPSYPTTDASATHIDQYFHDHRTWLLGAVVIQGTGIVLWLVFLCGLTTAVARSRSTGAALVTFTGGLLNVAISLTGLACVAALSFHVAGAGAAGLSSALFLVASMTLVLSNFLLALMAAGVAFSGLPAWFRWVSGAGAVVFALGAGAFAQSGAWSPDGVVQFATYGFELVWTLAGSFLLLGQTRRDPSRDAATPVRTAAVA